MDVSQGWAEVGAGEYTESHTRPQSTALPSFREIIGCGRELVFFMNPDTQTGPFMIQIWGEVGAHTRRPLSTVTVVVLADTEN